MSTLELPPRILVLGDIHGRMVDLVAAFQTAARHQVTAVLQVGDNWLYSPRELVKIDRQARRYGIESYSFLDGNHEDFGLLGDLVDLPEAHALSERTAYLGRGARFYVGNRTAIALGGGVSIDRFTEGFDSLGRRMLPRRQGVDWWPREAFTETDKNTALSGGPVDLVFSHDSTVEGTQACGIALGRIPIHPVSLADDQASRRLLGETVAALGPQMLLHGHLHVRASGTGRDDVQYEALGYNGRPGSMVLLDAESLSVQDTPS